MNRAKQMLISTSEPIARISADCGFGTASYFAQLFVCMEAMMAAVYRKLHK